MLQDRSFYETSKVKPQLSEGGSIYGYYAKTRAGLPYDVGVGLSLGGASNLPNAASRPYTITNISNKRNVTQVYAWGNDVNGYQSPFYGVYRNGGKGLNSESSADKTLNKTVNMQQEEFDQLRKAKYISDIYDAYAEWKEENISPTGECYGDLYHTSFA